ncbi:hypothetical protein SERLA73DRAFT_141681, partial [Serpula lacrymans var. lacrymans S7.3]
RLTMWCDVAIVIHIRFDVDCSNCRRVTLYDSEYATSLILTNVIEPAREDN